MVVATAADDPSPGALPPQAANVGTPNTINNSGIIRPPTRYASGNLFAYVLVPEVRIGGDEGGHQLDAPGVVHDLDHDPLLGQQVLAP